MASDLPLDPYRSASDPFMARQIGELQVISAEVLAEIRATRTAVSGMADRLVRVEHATETTRSLVIDDDKRIRSIESRPFSWLRVAAASFVLVAFGSGLALAAQAALR